MEKVLQIYVVNLLNLISKASSPSVCAVGDHIESYLCKACCHESPEYRTTIAVGSTITLLVEIRKCCVVVVVVVFVVAVVAAASSCVRLSSTYFKFVQPRVFRKSNSDANKLGQEGSFLCLVVGFF